MSALTLAYHRSTETELAPVKAALTKRGWLFNTIVCAADEPGALGGMLAATDGEIILFVNDELLHSLPCQVGLLAAYRTLHEQKRIHVVLASSRRQGPGNIEARVLTSLSRVSDVIRYMNYWQNAYLVKRRELGSSLNAENAMLLSPVRDVSQEIGELLRLIREDKLYNIYELLDNNGALLEKMVGIPPKQMLPAQPSISEETQPIQEIQSSTQQDVAEETPQTSSIEAAAATGLPAVADKFGPTVVQDHLSTSASNLPTDLPAASSNEPTSPDLQVHSTDLEGEPMQSADLESTDAADPSFTEHVPLTSPDVAFQPVAPATTLSQQVEVEPESDRQREVEEEPTLKELAERAQAQTRENNAAKFLSLLEQNEEDSAINFAGRVLTEDPDNDKIRYYYAISLLSRDSKGDKKEARHQLIQLSESKFAAQAALALGNLALEERDYGSARRHLKLAYKLNKHVDAELTYTLGALVQSEFPERRKEAEKFLKRAVKDSKANKSDAWYRYGQVLLANGKLKRAAKALTKAKKQDASHPFASYDLALVYLKLEKPAKAFKYFNLAVEANPELNTTDNRAAFTPVAPEVSSDKFNTYLASNAVESDDDFSLSLAQKRAIAKANKTKLTVLITGATSGIGEATARIFAQHGHRLILTGRRVEKLRGLSAELSHTYDTQVRLLSFDVSKLAETQQLLSTLSEGWQDIDVLINNAGKAKGLDYINEGSFEHWEEMIDTNIKGLLYMTRLVSPGMVERKKGHIINVCSTAGHDVYAKGAVYCATKHAVDAITKGTRLDLHMHNIRVSQVSPAAVEETEFSAVRFDGDEERAASVYKDFQPLRSSDVARIIYNIASEPPHVNVQDVLMLSTQQANSTTINRSGR